MTRKFVEARLDILEDAVQSLTARRNHALPIVIEARVERLEKAVDHLIDLAKSALEREETDVRRELAKVGLQRERIISTKKKTVLQRATKKPVKRRRRASVRR